MLEQIAKTLVLGKQTVGMDEDIARGAGLPERGLSSKQQAVEVRVVRDPLGCLIEHFDGFRCLLSCYEHFGQLLEV